MSGDRAQDTDRVPVPMSMIGRIIPFVSMLYGFQHLQNSLNFAILFLHLNAGKYPWTGSRTSQYKKLRIEMQKHDDLPCP